MSGMAYRAYEQCGQGGSVWRRGCWEDRVGSEGRMGILTENRTPRRIKRVQGIKAKRNIVV